jgi:hypothetical protein
MSVNPYHELRPIKESPPDEVTSFVVCGMFTANYAEKARKLQDSLDNLSLSYVLYEIPSIHSSISRHGKVDSEFNKPRFIAEMMGRYNLPILYLDVDCVIEEEPKLIYDLASKAYDFAIFNWLSKERNDAYTSVNVAGFEANRFYTYSHGIYALDENQLRSSGAVQFWGNTELAKLLLSKWDAVISENPHTADDVSLDFSYNNSIDRKLLRSFWLPKSYARYAFWIFDKPIINHPDMPDSGSQFQQIKVREGEFWVDERSMQKKPELFYIMPNTFLEIIRNQIVIFQGGMRLKISENTLPIYID